jgi:hypothetical protein
MAGRAEGEEVIGGVHMVVIGERKEGTVGMRKPKEMAPCW